MDPRDPRKQAAAVSAEPTLPLPEGISDGLDLDKPSLAFVDPERWVVEREIARGGMGRILRAFDRTLGRTVAIKQALSRDLGSVRRFEREALVTARLQHPGIIPIYEAGRAPGGEPFFVMRLVEGISLETALAEASTPAARMALLPALLAVADTVAYAHSRGIVHRDLKPANILVGSFGDVVVADWGLAKLTGEAAGTLPGMDSGSAVATSFGTILGTPSFMSPEQARGADVDARTDVFAIGCLLYTLLAGRSPYTGNTANEVIQQVLTSPPPSLRVLAPATRGDLLAIVAKAMERDPKDRYQSAGELAADLRRYATGRLVVARQYTRVYLAWRWAREHRLLLALVAVTVLALLFAGGAVSRQRRETALRAHLLQGDGRRELLRGRNAAAARLLAESEALRPSPRTRMMLGEAMRVVRTHRSSYPAYEGPITFMLSSPAGDRLATGGDDGRVFIWSATSAKPIAEARAHTEAVTWVAYSADGSRIVTSSWDRTAALIDASSGDVLMRFVGHTEPLNVAVISRDLKHVLTTSDDGTARLWDAATGKEIRMVGEKVKVMWAAEFLSGNRIATLDGESQLRIFDLASGRLLHESAPRGWAGRQIAESPDASRIVIAGETGAQLFDARMKWIADLGHSEIIWDATYSRDGTTIATIGSDDEASVWDAVTGRRISGCRNRGGAAVNWARFSPDGTLLATANADGTVLVCSVADGRVMVSLDGTGWVAHAVAWIRGGTGLTTAGDNGIVHFWDSPQPAEEFPLPGVKVQHAVWSPDGTRIATAGLDGDVILWDAASRKPVLTLEGHEAGVATVQFSVDGERVVSGAFDGSARVWDARSGALVRILPVESRELFAGFAGGKVYTAGKDGFLRWWDPETGAKLSERQFSQPSVFFSAAASPDGSTTVWAGPNGMKAEPGGTLPRMHDGEIPWVEFSDDGRRFATVGYSDGSVVLWNVETLQPYVRLPANGATYADFSPDGSWVVTCSGDGVDVWDAATGAQVLNLDAHFGATWSAEFSPDGSRLVTAGEDMARVWHLGMDPGSPEEIERALEPFLPDPDWLLPRSEASGRR